MALIRSVSKITDTVHVCAIKLQCESFGQLLLMDSEDRVEYVQKKINK